jgi:DNA-binding LytR/AlgR family response regulator
MTDLSGAKLAGIELNVPPEDSGDAVLLPPAHHVGAEKTPKAAGLRPRLERSPQMPVKIAIKTKGKILLINPAEILAVEAEGNYVLLQSQSESYLLRESISSIARKLMAYGFVRVHRSVLVNAACVEEIRTGANGECTLRISGGREVAVSRTYRNNLKSLARSWIGTDSFVEE